ncbi:transcription factor, putative [Plasmodium berghei]|nr:transcription factor, putative [Plasmodium berghei]SCN25895.1 transcription factor, putative [Plasmodium berghei]
MTSETEKRSKMKKKHKNDDDLNQNKEKKENANHYNDKYEEESENSEKNVSSLSPLIYAHDQFESESKRNNKRDRMKKDKSNILKRETSDYIDNSNSSSHEGSNSNNKMDDQKKKEKKKMIEEKSKKKEKTREKYIKEEESGIFEKNKEKKIKENKNSNFSIDNVTTEDILNYFIDHYNNEISIEHDELCQILTGKKYFDIERLTKNSADITHQSIMIKSIQKEKKQFCKHCGYIFNYDDYNYLFIKRFNMSKINYDDNNPVLCENTIKCIYCGYIIEDLDINENINYNTNNYIELHSYREKYLFDNNKKTYWQNKIATFDKNIELFKEGESGAYNITYEKCTDCDHDFLYFVNIQTRSADEGSTIIYFCPNCKKQTTVNN